MPDTVRTEKRESTTTEEEKARVASCQFRHVDIENFFGLTYPRLSLRSSCSTSLHALLRHTEPKSCQLIAFLNTFMLCRESFSSRPLPMSLIRRVICVGIDTSVITLFQCRFRVDESWGSRHYASDIRYNYPARRRRMFTSSVHSQAHSIQSFGVLN